MSSESGQGGHGRQAQLPGAGALVDGKYVLERLLGQGGMGAVFAARHKTLGHQVAIKVMLADATNQEASQRFINEGRAAAHIQNDHVVRVSDVGSEQGYAYMVLELLEGEDLSQVLERRVRLPVHEAASYVMQALRGVADAHGLGIIHRDLKPANLFLAKKRDGSQVVKILDFGISKAHGAQAALGASPGQLTSTKAMLGSPLYMSPEQLRSSKSVDVRADIWAMGVILFELTTGTVPFNGENLGELFAAILETDAPNARTVVADLPVGFEHVIMKCLQKRPEHRFQNVGEIMQALQPFTVPQSGPMHVPTVAMGALQAPPSARAAGPVSGFGVTTGSGANIPVVKGVTPFAGTPDPSLGTSRAAGVPAKSNQAVLAVVGVAMSALVLGGIAVAVFKSRPAAAPPAASVAITTAAPPKEEAPVASASLPVPPAPTPSPATPIVTATAAPSSPVTAAVSPPPKHVVVPVANTTKKPAAPATPPPATTTPPAPKPTSTNNGGFGGFMSR